MGSDQRIGNSILLFSRVWPLATVWLWEKPIRRIAKWRCERDKYRWPIERQFGKWLFPGPQLS
jgi:hypothetical protein